MIAPVIVALFALIGVVLMLTPIVVGVWNFVHPPSLPRR